MQLDVQQAAIDLATEVPYETASSLFGRLSGIAVSSERLHTFTTHVAEGLSVLDVAPPRDEIDQRVARVAAGRFRRPVLVLGIDGAYVPSRPDSARGRRTGRLQGDVASASHAPTCSVAISMPMPARRRRRCSWR